MIQGRKQLWEALGHINVELILSACDNGGKNFRRQRQRAAALDLAGPGGSAPAARPQPRRPTLAPACAGNLSAGGEALFVGIPVQCPWPFTLIPSFGTLHVPPRPQLQPPPLTRLAPAARPLGVRHWLLVFWPSYPGHSL